MENLGAMEQPTIETGVGSAVIQVAMINHVLANNKALTEQRRNELKHDLERNEVALETYWRNVVSCEYASIDEKEFELKENDIFDIPYVILCFHKPN